LPSTKIEAAPPQRNIDTTELAFNTVLEPPPAVTDESAVAALASALRLELAEARAVVAAGKPIALARSQTRAESEMIAELVSTCGFRAVVISDQDLSPERELVRARRIDIEGDQIQVHHSGGVFGFEKSEATLLVLGELSNTRVDYTEGISGGRGKSGRVLDTSEYRSGETLLDVYAASLDKSFRIKSDAFDYSGLVSPLSFRSDLNFLAAVLMLRAALPLANFDDDFKTIRNLLGRAWPERIRNEPRGFKRTGLAFRAVAQASVLSNNRDQFERYSRLMFRFSSRKSG
jgi:hypothetical protein